LTFISEYQKLPGMDPASAIIEKLGGEAKVAEITGMAFTAPYRWQHDKSKGGTGGLIPQAHHRALLDYANAKSAKRHYILMNGGTFDSALHRVPRWNNRAYINNINATISITPMQKSVRRPMMFKRMSVPSDEKLRPHKRNERLRPPGARQPEPLFLCATQYTAQFKFHSSASERAITRSSAVRIRGEFTCKR
jgi:hypothetical protein